MVPRTSHIQPFLLLGVCTLGCLVPTAWVALPAGAILLFWLPGRSLARLLRPLNSISGRGWLAVALSLAVMPAGLHLLWHFSNARLAVLAAVVLIDLVLMLAAACTGPDMPVTSLFASRRHRRLFIALIVWTAGWVFLFYWVPVAGGRVAPNPSGDFIKHHAILWSLDHYRLPLHNIFFAAEADAGYYYYELFYLLPAALRRLSGDTISLATAFGVCSGVVAGVFVALVFMMARSLIGHSRGALLAAACASIIGGWDIIAVVVRLIAQHIPVVIMDSWAPVAWRIHNLMSNFIWCPQHIAAMTVVLLACVMLAHAPRQAWWIVMAPLLAAVVFGMSAYQAMIVFPAAALYVLHDLFRASREPRTSVRRYIAAIALVAVLGAAAMLPRALDYRTMSLRYEGGLTLQWPRFEYAFFGKLVPPGPLANLLDAPWMALIDFGIVAVAAIFVSGVIWRRIAKDSGTRLLLIAAVPGLLCMWSIRSDVNRIDYGFRLASMPAQIIGAILVGCMLQIDMVRPAFRRWRRPALVVGLALGLPVGFYETPGLALRSLIERKPEAADTAAAAWMRDHLPADAIVQADPRLAVHLPQRIGRQFGVLDPQDAHVNVLCPPDRTEMPRAVDDVEAALATSSSAQAYQLLRRWDISHVFVGTREHKHFSAMPQFADGRYFEMVYDEHGAQVYRLRPAARATQAGD